MKAVHATILLALLTMPLNAKSISKYKKGDCITPTNTSYTWHGKIARVEAVSHIQGYDQEQCYILVILDYKSNTAIFDLSIESDTKNVDSAQCLN